MSARCRRHQSWGRRGGQVKPPSQGVVLSRLLFPGLSSPLVCHPLADRNCLIHTTERKKSYPRRRGVPCSLALENGDINRAVVTGQETKKHHLQQACPKIGWPCLQGSPEDMCRGPEVRLALFSARPSPSYLPSQFLALLPATKIIFSLTVSM